MTKEVVVCDHCGAVAKDHPYDEYGWVIIEGHASITLTEGRKADRTAKTKYRTGEGAQDRHFCSIEHLVAYIRHEPYVAAPRIEVRNV